MITALYASICAIILIKLSLNVIKLRRKHQISLGHGNIKELQIAIGAHSNASQYIPISLILLFLLEINQANVWLIHLLGISIVISRLIHAQGMNNKMPARVLGMQLTIINILALSFVNIFYYFSLLWT